MESNQRPEVRVYIDGANLHKGVNALGWRLDYRRFRSWIRQKYEVDIATVFIGMISSHANLYSKFQVTGYRVMFKEVVFDSNGKAKGNCDADLVLQATRDVFEHKIGRAILVSSDGDYAPLIQFWQEKHILCVILSPAKMNKCSWLLRKTNVPTVYLDDVKDKIRRL